MPTMHKLCTIYALNYDNHAATANVTSHVKHRTGWFQHSILSVNISTFPMTLPGQHSWQPGHLRPNCFAPSFLSL